MAVTIKDVAERAKVSTASVSYMINNGPRNVSEKTRAKIEKAIRETGYSPNAVARSLKTTRTYNLGLLITDIKDPFFLDLILGVQAEAIAHNYNVFLCSSQNDIELERHYIEQLRQQNVDGLIVAGSHLDQETLHTIATTTKTIILSPHKIQNAVQFFIDDYEGGRMVGEYLLMKGHRKIRYIEGSWMASDSHRLDGLCSVLEDASVNTSNIVGAIANNVSYEAGFSATLEALGKYPDTTALFCYNDTIASGAINACRELGYRVPQDISIIGFDDTEVAKSIFPALTTVNTNSGEIGTQMTRVLISILSNKMLGPELIKLPLKLIERDSTSMVNRSG
ncbi:MAG: LacI family transcriptional regulator [Spirochaetales bacterium]|jgi:LacI family transcriptional regulator|nr:LacI family transcriptional regulator [Spirochaetales bacterium]